jgi:hypothetical protein
MVLKQDTTTASGGGFQGTDVPPFAADDAAFQIIAGQLHHRDGALGDEFTRQPFDGDGDDLLRLTVGFLARFLLDQTDVLGGLVFGLVDHRLDELLARLIARQARRALELITCLLDQPLELFLSAADHLLAVLDALFAFLRLGIAAVDLFGAAIEGLFAPRQSLLRLLNLSPLLFDLLFKFLSGSKNRLLAL